ncbi:MAG: glycosyltransferase [Pseudomonadota bacterium]
MRVLFWVQQLLGSGHVKRAGTLAEAMARHGLQVTVAAGGMPMPSLLPVGIDVVQLPSIRTSDPSFAALVDADGKPVDDALWQERQVRLQAILAELQPQVVMTEMFPFGRRAFRRELLPLLETAGAMRPRPWRLGSVRDILVHKPVRERFAWMRDVARSHYDRVLVHTDPKLIPFDLTFPFAAELGDLLVNTGYVVEESAVPTGVPEVVVSAGGGGAAGALLDAAIEARPISCLAEAPWRLVAGSSFASDAFERLQDRLPPGIALDRHRDDFGALFANSLLSVSQAGYNTVVEGLKLGKPMVLVPFETASETEQRIRAERLAGLGLATIVRESELTASSLAHAIDTSYEQPRAAGQTLDLNGAEETALLVKKLAALPAPVANHDRLA